MTVSNMFNMLNASKQRYSVLSDYTELPHNLESKVVILCDDKKAVADVIKFRDGRSDYAEGVQIALIGRDETGLPDLFVSRVLDRSYRHNEIVQVPDNYEATLLILAGMAMNKFENITFSNQSKRILIEFLNERLGGNVRETGSTRSLVS